MVKARLLLPSPKAHCHGGGQQSWPRALGVAPALWVPLGKGQQLLWGAVAAGSQQAAVPWHRELWSSSCVGTGPGVTHSAGSVPQLTLSRAWLCAPGAAHVDGHMLVWAPPGHGPTFLGIQKKCVWAHHSTPSSLAAAACPSAWHGLVTPAPRWHELPWVLSAQHTPACSNLGPAQRVYGAFSDTQAPPLNIPLLRCPHGCNTA